MLVRTHSLKMELSMNIIINNVDAIDWHLIKHHLPDTAVFNAEKGNVVSELLTTELVKILLYIGSYEEHLSLFSIEVRI